MEYIKCPHCGQEQMHSSAENTCIKCGKRIAAKKVEKSPLVVESTTVPLKKTEPKLKMNRKWLSRGLTAILFIGLLTFIAQGFHGYENRIHNLQDQLSGIQDEIAALTEENATLLEENSRLSGLNSTLTSEISSLQEQISAYEETIASLQAGRSSASGASSRGGSGGSAASESVSAPVADSSGVGEVYVTEHGKKYHNSGCSYLSKSKIPMSRANARAQGFEPCKRCNAT